MTTIRVTNVLVVGAGAAGLRAAIAAYHFGVQVLVLGHRPRRDAHTRLAAGGINAVLGTRDPEDSWQAHAADTLGEGYLLGDPAMVEILARESPEAIRELAAWGCPFTRTDDGQIDQRYFGAHRFRRTAYAGDHTGRAVLDTLADQAEALRVPMVDGLYVSRLLVDDNRCFGVLAFDVASGERTALFADAVILATGGHTRLWRPSSSRRDENTGDGMALALRAGGVLADMELVQFHPTGMTHPEEWAGTLVTEAARGEGAYLRNAEGERFMARYDAERMELSTRDVVAVAGYTEIAQGRGGPHGGVFLDLRHIGKEEILRKLPRIYRQLLEAQMIDISAELIEVSPTAHYSMGGVIVDPEDGATGVEGLYAVGETTAGLHGANRLGGNSLAETVVFGRRVGQGAARRVRALESQFRSAAALAEAEAELDDLIGHGHEFALPLMRRVRNLMWERCGVVRDEDAMRLGLDELDEIRALIDDVDVRPTSEGWQDLARVLALRAAIDCGELTLRGALERRESRGAHVRRDAPEIDEKLRTRITFSLVNGTVRQDRRALPEIPAAWHQWLDDSADIKVAGRLLE